MKKLRIMYISHERKMGGANLCLFELAKEMKERGHEVCVTVLQKKCPLAVALKEAHIDTIPAFFGWWQMPQKWNPVYKLCFRMLYCFEFIQLYRLSFLVKKKKIDIIHSNSSCIDLGMKLSQKTGVPHIWHFREFGAADYNLEYLKGRKKSIEYVNKNAKNIIFISQALRKYYRDILAGENRKVIYDGVSEDYLCRPDYLLKNEIVFLTAGNLSKNKNQKLVLEAALILQKKDIKNFKIKVAGAASALRESQNYEAALHDYKEKHRLEQVEFLGYVKDMNDIRKDVNVEIVPSVQEAFGRVTVEAMLSGKPVIASDSGANVELIENGRNGLLFEKGNAVALAEQMQYFIEHPEKIVEMGKYANELACRKYLLSCNAMQIEQMYSAVTEEISGDNNSCMI